MDIPSENYLDWPGRVGDAALEVFEEHELVERVVPLHEEHAARQGATQILDTHTDQFSKIHIERVGG